MVLAVNKIANSDIVKVLDIEPEKTAKLAGLRYIRADSLRIERKKVGRGFSYHDRLGDRITDEAELERLKSLTIPPALTDVVICHLPHGHLQATGKDAKQRKQYFYHPDWRKIRDRHKFNRMVLFAASLPQIRATTAKHLRQKGLSREKVLATVVQLLETTLIRVGNSQYAKNNRSFGLTTLRDRHIDITGTKVKFEFRGKSGVDHEIELRDRRLANVIKQCQEIPGYEVFKYYDESGDKQLVDSADVNEYLQTITGQEFTAKDFRTWAGTLLAAIELDEIGEFDSENKARKNITQAIKNVAKQLGNRPATCRKYYIHPAILEAYEDGSLLDLISQTANIESKPNQLSPEEKMVLNIIQQSIPRP